MKGLKITLAVILSMAVVFFITVIAKADSFPPLPEALNAMESDGVVEVQTRKLPFAFFNPVYFVFKPAGIEPTKGFIFYPGGLVDPRSYAPPARAIAKAGYMVVIVSMPFDLAPFGYWRGIPVLIQYPDIKTWAIGGHSVGGSFACAFAKMFTWMVDGVIIWASYPSSLLRIDNTQLKVVLIYGTNNPNCNDDEIEENKPYLPDDTLYVRIEGANHTQFGYYDTSPEPFQPDDDFADISRQEQQKQILDATIGFLDKL